MTSLSPTRQLIASIAGQKIQEAGDDGGSHQAVMNTAYAKWNKAIEREKMRPEGVDDPPKPDLSLEGFTNSLEDPERLAVIFGKLNQQVNNGGFVQWIDNGYKDAAMPYLQDYLDKYRGKYPGIEKVARIFERIDSCLEDDDTCLADYNDHKHGSHTIIDKVDEAAGEGNWENVDELLGGTDRFRHDPMEGMLEEVNDLVTVETEQKDGQFIGCVRFDNYQKRIVARTKVSYATEEEAIDAAETLSEEWINSEKGEEELEEKATELLCDEAHELAEKHAEQSKTAFEQADDMFYEGAGDQMLLDIEDILNTEYAMAGQGDKFIDDLVSSDAGKSHVASFKAQRAVSAATARYRAERQPAA